MPTRGGLTYPAEHNAKEEPEKRFGIHLDRAIVNGEATGCAYGTVTRHLLVHELQHAISHDSSTALAKAAGEAHDQYDWPNMPTAESRADIARVLYAEMEQRRASGGPALNELPAEQRAEVVREVLTQYITPIDNPPRDLADVRLREVLRSDTYHHQEENSTWRTATDDRTDAYGDGLVAYSPDEPFIPSGMDAEARKSELATPLPELAERWAQERTERVDSPNEWAARYNPEAGPPARAEPAANVRTNGTAGSTKREESRAAEGVGISGWEPACNALEGKLQEKLRERAAAAAGRGGDSDSANERRNQRSDPVVERDRLESAGPKPTNAQQRTESPHAVARRMLEQQDKTPERRHQPEPGGRRAEPQTQPAGRSAYHDHRSAEQEVRGRITDARAERTVPSAARNESPVQ